MILVRLMLIVRATGRPQRLALHAAPTEAVVAVLTSSIQTGVLGRAIRLADRIRAATVRLDGWQKHHPNAPFGGFKMCGYGREQGADALESHTQHETVRANLA